MPNRAGNARAICPFFISEDKNNVRCEGFSQSIRVQLVFERNEDKQNWMEGCCMRFDYEEACPLAAMMTALHEERAFEDSEP